LILGLGTVSATQVVDADVDVVVDALPGCELAESLASHFLARGIHVVSANKSLIAEHGYKLHALAARNAARLYYSAAVGGSTPMLETLRRERRRGAIASIAGVLNGTCNYVLDRCAQGWSLDEAVRDAQAHGFAEADPTDDLSGRDASRKLQILAREAFEQDLRSLEIEPLNTETLESARQSLGENHVLRIVARIHEQRGEVVGQIRLEAFASTSPFSHINKEWNCLVVTRASGEQVVVLGRGAGRWATTEAILGDVFELCGVQALPSASVDAYNNQETA
jgi:homoserine dehydrogenase